MAQTNTGYLLCIELLNFIQGSGNTFLLFESEYISRETDRPLEPQLPASFCGARLLLRDICLILSILQMNRSIESNQLAYGFAADRQTSTKNAEESLVKYKRMSDQQPIPPTRQAICI